MPLQAGLCLTWSESEIVGFLMQRLKCKLTIKQFKYMTHLTFLTFVHLFSYSLIYAKTLFIFLIYTFMLFALLLFFFPYSRQLLEQDTVVMMKITNEATTDAKTVWLYILCLLELT